MRARDRDTYPTAPRDSIYGCRRCGNYQRITAGVKLACQNCRTSIPMVDVADAATQPAGDSKSPPQSSR